MAKFDAGSISKPNLKSSGAATFQAQQAIGNMSAGQAKTASPGQVSQMGAQVTSAEGKEQAQNLATAQGKAKQKGQIEINRTATQQRAKLNKRRNNSRTTALEARQRINTMGRDLDSKLFGERMQFEKDSRGVKFKNARQLADFKKMVAKDDEEFEDFAQEMTQRSTEKMKILQIANAKISQQLTQLSKARESAANHAQKVKLLKAKAALDRKIKRDAARAKNTAMIFQGVGMAAGAYAGSFVGQPVLGAQLGAAAGTGVAGATS